MAGALKRAVQKNVEKVLRNKIEATIEALM